MKWLRILLVALLLAVFAAIVVSCADLLKRPLITPGPAESEPAIITPSTDQPVSPTSTPEPTTTATETASVAAVLDPSGPHPSPTHTPLPQSTITQPPLLPSSTATPNDSSGPSPTFTPTPEIPKAAIQIADPGPLSRILSPLELTATLHTMPAGSYRIELWAEPLIPGGEPRLLLREVQNFIADPIPWIFLDQPLEFELSRVSELGELRILTYDRFGRQVAAASVDLVLLQYGENQLTPGGDVLEPLVILDPAPNILIQGGILSVAGLARPLDSQPLLIELVAADGTIAGVHQVFLTPDPAGRHIPFTADVSYEVDSPTWVRLIISQSSARIPGIRILNSLEILLSP